MASDQPAISLIRSRMTVYYIGPSYATDVPFLSCKCRGMLSSSERCTEIVKLGYTLELHQKKISRSNHPFPRVFNTSTYYWQDVPIAR